MATAMESTSAVEVTDSSVDEAPQPDESEDAPAALELIAEEEEEGDGEGEENVDRTDDRLLEQAVATPTTRLDERLRIIESQNRAIAAQNGAMRTELAETRAMVHALTQLVERWQPQGLIPPPRGPSPALLKSSFGPTFATVTEDASDSYTAPTNHSGASHKASVKPRGPNTETVAAPMTRTISTKGMPIALNDGVAEPAISLAITAKVMRRLAHVASRKTFRVPDMIVPMLTRRFSVSTLSYDPVPVATVTPTTTATTTDTAVSAASKTDGVTTSETSSARRVSRWSQALANKARVEPIVTKTDVITARREDSPSHPLTIRHDATGRFAWDAVVLVITMIDAVMTPLSLSFGYYPRSLAIFNALETVAFTIDFCVQALSSYTTKRGGVVFGPANTIPHYLLSIWALADFLSGFPFEYLVSTGGFLGIAKIVRLVKISQLMRRFHSARKAGMFRLIRLISIVLLVSHMLACYWNWVAKVWRLNEEGYVDKPIAEQYVHCWSIVIGSLNASPPVMHTPIEEISVAVFMLIGNVLQASVFGSVAALIQSFDEDEVAYNKKLIHTYERCKMLDIPEPLADRINSFYEHLYRETRSIDPDADSFISELSPALNCEVKFQLYRDMVKQIPFFSSAEINPVLIEMLILKLRTVIYMQDDMLIRKGEFGDWMGFVGSKGSVGVLDPNSDVHKIVRILRKGDYFGEMSLLHRTKRTTTAVALSWVQIHVLSRCDLDEVKEQYVEDAESLELEIRKYIRSRLSSGSAK